jgi:hypothetical protein
MTVSRWPHSVSAGNGHDTSDAAIREHQRVVLNGYLIEAGYPPVSREKWATTPAHQGIVAALRRGLFRMKKNDTE